MQLVGEERCQGWRTSGQDQSQPKTTRAQQQFALDRERILEKCISDYIISIPLEEEELVVVGAGVDAVGTVGEDVAVVTGLNIVGAA